MNTNSTRDGRRPIAFISHHSSQEQTARHLKNILERNGVEGWMAPDDIEPGRPFDQAIIEEVEACDLIVLLFCAKSDQSRHVKRELMMAENHKKLIYPIRLEDIDAKGLAYWLNDYQWIDWIDRRDETIDKLIETIKKQVPSDPPVDDKAPDKEGTAVAADPAPADNAPMALAGAAGDTPAKMGLLGLTRASWIVIAGIGAILVIALLLAIGGSNSGGEDQSPLRAGNWQTTLEVNDISVVNAPPEVEAMARQQMAEQSSTTECITPAEAADPGGEIFTVEELDLGNNCRVLNSRFANGNFRFRANCQLPNNGRNQVTLTGRYNRTQMVGDLEMDIDSPVGSLDVEAEFVSERIGDCN